MALVAHELVVIEFCDNGQFVARVLPDLRQRGILLLLLNLHVDAARWRRVHLDDARVLLVFLLLLLAVDEVELWL